MAHAQSAEQCLGLLRIIGDEVIAATVHHGDAITRHAIGAQVGGDELRRHDQCGIGVAGSAQRRLVPLRAACRGGLGMPAPCHVVHRDDMADGLASPRRRGGQRDRVHDIKAGGGVHQAVIPGVGQQRSGQVRESDRPFETGQRVRPVSHSRERRSGKAAGQQGDVDVSAICGTLCDTTQQSPGVGTDATRHSSPQLFDGHQHPRFGSVTHEPLRCRGTSGPTPRHSDPS